MGLANYRDTSPESMLRKLALQLFELRRPRTRELLPQEKLYLAALEKMEAEGNGENTRSQMCSPRSHLLAFP